MKDFDISPADITYLVAMCTTARVGDAKKHSNVQHDWKTNADKKFLNWHYHRFWAVTAGRARVKTTFGDFDLIEGHVYYIPACTILESECLDYMEQFYVDFIPKSIFISINDFYDFGTISDDYELIISLMKVIQKTYLNNDSASVFSLNACMSAIMSCFFKSAKEHSINVHKFLSVLDYINENYNNKITIADLSNLIGYSPEYFCNLFKKALNMSPIQFIINKRISIAKTLLLTTDHSINEIAELCGYADPLYFSRIFYTNVSVSPSLFRKQNIVK